MIEPILPTAKGRAIPSIELLTFIAFLLFDDVSIAEVEDEELLPVNLSLAEELERSAKTREAGRNIPQHKLYNI